jgi:spore germination protein YaaH
MCRTQFRLVSLVILAALSSVAPACAQRAATAQPSEFWAFTGPWDVESARSLRAHGGRLQAVVTGWITLDSLTGLPVLPSPYPDTVRPLTGTPTRMAIVTSWHGERFHAGSIRGLAVNATRLGRAAGAIARHASEMGYGGLVFDFETLESRDLSAQINVMKAIADSARSHGVRTIAAAIPATDTSAYPVKPLLGVADYLIVMLYDQHWLGSAPGPISAPAWVESSLARRVREAGPERLITGLPTYGYHWRRGQPTLPVTFAEAQRAATGARTQLTRDSATQTLRAVIGSGEEIWMTDATLLDALVRASKAQGVHRFALWRLGQEDPAIWGRVVR